MEKENNHQNAAQEGNVTETNPVNEAGETKDETTAAPQRPEGYEGELWDKAKETHENAEVAEGEQRMKWDDLSDADRNEKVRQEEFRAMNPETVIEEPETNDENKNSEV